MASYVDMVEGAESSGNPNAHNALSSASGPDGFINGTWLSMIRQHRPDIAAGKSDAEILSLKSDPTLSAQMTAAYAADNAGILKRNGLPVTAGTQYLSHFAGPQGAVGILNADPSTPAAAVLGQGFAKANPTLAGYTSGQLAAWADRKMGAGAAPMSIAGPQAAASAPAPSQDQPPQPQQQAAAPRRAAPTLDPSAIAQMAAVPTISNLLPQRPNYFGQTAPFSLGG